MGTRCFLSACRAHNLLTVGYAQRLLVIERTPSRILNESCSLPRQPNEILLYSIDPVKIRQVPASSCALAQISGGAIWRTLSGDALEECVMRALDHSRSRGTHGLEA